MPRQISEERTRKEMKVPPLFGGIDPQLEQAGWYLRDHSKGMATGTGKTRTTMGLIDLFTRSNQARVIVAL